MNSTFAFHVLSDHKHEIHDGHGNQTGQEPASHTGHNHGASGIGCKTEMLWNWNTIDSCFLTSSWHIKSTAMFAGSCIGIFILAILAVLLRRLTNEYDAYLARKLTPIPGPPSHEKVAVLVPQRPTIAQQLIRSVLFAAHVFLGYILMLLAMYYNGYIIISIIAGFFVGFLACEWRRLGSNATAAANAQHSSSHC